MTDPVGVFGAPDQVAQRRLRIAQMAFRSADALFNTRSSDADRVSIVVQLDFAIETLLRAVLLQAGHLNARAHEFKKLLDGVDDFLRSQAGVQGLSSRVGVDLLRGVRNAAQHGARVPTNGEVAESVVHARLALVELTQHSWGTSFLATDVELIQSQRAKQLILRGAAAFDDGDLPAAMGWVAAAFAYGFTHGGENLVGPDVKVRALMVVDRPVRTGEDPDPFNRGSDAAIALRRLQVVGRLNAFGIDIAEYLFWREKFAAAPHLNIKDDLIRHETERTWERDDYEKASLYVVESILKMEQIVPDVDPGGFHRGGTDKL